jgi:chitosanase
VAASHADETKKETALRITSTAENSTKDWTAAYAYIEDIHDGRGYTGGLERVLRIMERDRVARS